MTIAVTTPTGNVGSQLVRRLVQAGERPVASTNSPNALVSPSVTCAAATCSATCRWTSTACGRAPLEGWVRTQLTGLG